MGSKKDEIALSDIYASFWQSIVYLWQRKWKIVIVGILACTLGVVYSLTRPEVYSSKLTFIVENSGNGGRLGALSGIASNFGISGLGESDGGLYQNQANLTSYLESRVIVEEALLKQVPDSKHSFAEEFARAYGWREEWNEDADLKKIDLSPGKDKATATNEEDSVLFEMYQFLLEEEILGVSIPNEDGSILSINMSVRSKAFARYFPQELLSIVVRNYSDTKTKLLRENVTILERQVDSVRTELDEALASSASAKDQVFGLNPAFDVERVRIGKEQVNIQVTSMLLGEMIKNLELARVKLMDQTPLIEVVDPPKYPLDTKENSWIKTGIIFGIAGGILAVLFFLGVRLVQRLHKEATINQ